MTDIIEDAAPAVKKSTDYTLKNKRRKDFYDGRSRDHRRARQLRKSLGGAFGKEKKELRGFLVQGTSAAA